MGNEKEYALSDKWVKEPVAILPAQPEMELFGSAQAKREKTKSGYKITAPGGTGSVMLKAGVDFGEVNGRTCLWKGGAEKICLAYGMLQHYTLELAEENFDLDKPVDKRNAFFFYRVRCDLVKVAQDGREYIFSTGRGSSNSLEKSNYKQSPYDVANKILKIASKRALASACVALAGASDLFSVDLDDDTEYQSGLAASKAAPGEERVSAAEVKGIFDTAERAGLSLAETKKILKDAGYKSANEIKHKDYERVCALFQNENK